MPNVKCKDEGHTGKNFEKGTQTSLTASSVVVSDGGFTRGIKGYPQG